MQQGARNARTRTLGPPDRPRLPQSRYRVEHEPVDNPDDEREREITRDSCVRVPQSMKGYQRGLLSAALGDDQQVSDCFRGLVNRARRSKQRTAHNRSRRSSACCDRSYLTGLLLQLREPQPPLTRKCLNMGASTMSKAAQWFRELEFSAHRLVVDPDRQFQNLGSLLSVVADRISLVAGGSLGTARGHDLELNLTLAAILRHVRVRTGGWRDDEIVVLVRALTGRDVDLKDWRKRHRDLLRAPTSMERGWYRWRRHRRQEARQVRDLRCRRAYGANGRRNYVTEALQAARTLHPESFGETAC